MTLLPPNATRQERQIEAATAARLGAVPVPIAALWDAASCPAPQLPWLAWTLSVDDWDADWPEAVKRRVVAGSAELHRIKGTRRAVMAALDAMGYGDARVIEDGDLPRYGAAVEYGGEWAYGPSDPHWADYWIEVSQPISRRDADRLAARVASVAPARCRLRGISLAGVWFTYGDGRWVWGDPVTYGGIYEYGDYNG